MNHVIDRIFFFFFLVEEQQEDSLRHGLEWRPPLRGVWPVHSSWRLAAGWSALS